MQPAADSARPAPPIPGPPIRDTGDTIVNQVNHAVDRLAGLDGLPVTEHVTRFEAVHAALTEALSSIDKV